MISTPNGYLCTSLLLDVHAIFFHFRSGQNLPLFTSGILPCVCPKPIHLDNRLLEDNIFRSHYGHCDRCEEQLIIWTLGHKVESHRHKVVDLVSESSVPVATLVSYTEYSNLDSNTFKTIRIASIASITRSITCGLISKRSG